MEIEEIWKPVIGYEGLYEVSNLGRVKSLIDNHGERRDKILKPYKEKKGYLRVYLYKGNKVKVVKVHRLVAQAFISNPDNLPQVNHINECKIDNRVENLEWCSAKYNINYGSRTEKMIKTQTNRSDCSKPVVQILDGKALCGYPSTMEAERQTGVNRGHISKVCLGKRKTAGGYIWRYS